MRHDDPMSKPHPSDHDKRDVRDVAEEVFSSRAGVGPAPYSYRGLVSVAEYRELMGDQLSPDAVIEARLEYLEALFRKVIDAKLDALFQTSL